MRCGRQLHCRSVFLLLVLGLCGTATAALDATADMIGRHDNCPYVYVRVTVRNTGGGKVGYELEIDSEYTGRGRLTLTAPPLDPGDTRVHNLAVPFVRWPTLKITDSQGDRKPIGMSAGYSYSGIGKRFLNISETEAQVSPKDLEDFTHNFQAFTSASPGSGSTSDLVISQIESRDLPENWLCYSPFHAVFIRDSAYRHLTQPEHDALHRWVESGGYLSIYGSDQATTTALGLGILERRDSNPVTISAKQFPPEWQKGGQSWQQFYNSTPESFFPYLSQKGAGRAGAFFIATLFLILAGPVNYFYYKRRGRIRMLMVSMPAISLGFCTLISAYFVGTQGFARHGGTVSMTMFDETTDHGFCVARSCLYSGLYPLGGFKFPAGTAFLPLVQADSYEVDLSNATVVKSGIFLPSTNFHYATCTPFQSRERLIYDANSQTAINGFEKPIDSVVLESGGKYFAGGKAPAGGKLTLLPVSDSELPASGNNTGVDRIVRLLTERTLSADERRMVDDRFTPFSAALLKQPGVHYAVLMTQNPSWAQTGVSIETPRNCDILLGLLDTSAAPPEKTPK